MHHKAEWYKRRKQPCDSLVANVFGIHFFIIFHPFIVFVLGVDSTGHPTIAAAGCSCSIGSVKIHFHGGARWMNTLILIHCFSITNMQWAQYFSESYISSAVISRNVKMICENDQSLSVSSLLLLLLTSYYYVNGSLMWNRCVTPFFDSCNGIKLMKISCFRHTSQGWETIDHWLRGKKTGSL